MHYEHMEGTRPLAIGNHRGPMVIIHNFATQIQF